MCSMYFGSFMGDTRYPKDTVANLSDVTYLSKTSKQKCEHIFLMLRISPKLPKTLASFISPRFNNDDNYNSNNNNDNENVYVS